MTKKVLPPKHFLIDFTTSEVVELFKDKYNCANCGHCMIYKGPIPFGCGNYHRMYCAVAYSFEAGLPLTLGVSQTEATVLAERIKKGHPLAPDVVRVHPENDKLFIHSVLLVKYRNNCKIDRSLNKTYKQSDELLKANSDWYAKYYNIKPTI
jgi:hypothetical protein